MAKKQKEWYYVVVFTSEGPKYVTGLGDHRTAYWDVEKAPYEMSKEWARDMVVGLLWNGYNAQVVMSPIELDTHPYRYETGCFEWKMKEDEENE